MRDKKCVSHIWSLGQQTSTAPHQTGRLVAHSQSPRPRVTSVVSASACCFKEQRSFGEDGNMISDRRLLIVCTQPQLGNNSERPSVGKGGKQSLEKDGMTECRKGWEDSRE